MKVMTVISGRSGWATAQAAVSAGGLVVVLATVGNLAVFLVARLLGAEFVVSPPGSAEMTVSIGAVVGMSVGALIVGTLVLVIVSRRGARAWRALAWVGLGVGLVSTGLPLSAAGSLSSRTALATMHVVTGLVWWVVLMRRASTIAVTQR